VTAPAFVDIDDDGFADDVCLSVAHLGQLRENALACINERMPRTSHSYASRNQQAAVRLPRLHSVRWVGWRPWRFWVPGLVGAFGASPTINLLLHYSVENHAMRVYLHNKTIGRGAPTASTLDAETASGATGQGRNLAVASNQTESIAVPVAPGRWNEVYLLFRSEHQTAALSTTTGLAHRGRTGTTINQQLTGPAADSIPEYFLYPTDDTGSPVDYTHAYTGAYYDADAYDGKVWIAEVMARATPREFAGMPATQTWQYGTLAVLELKSVGSDTTQAITMEDAAVGYWRGLRYRQPPRASRISAECQVADQMHEARLPQLCFTGGAADLSARLYPGLWAVDGTAEDTTNDPYSVGAYTTIYRRSWTAKQGLRDDDTATMEAAISAAYISETTDCTFRYRLTIRDDAGTVVASQTHPETWGKTSPYGLTAEWARLTSTQRISGLNTLTTPTASASKWSHDGCTALGDIDGGFWREIKIRVDVSGLSGVHYVDIDVDRQTAFGSTDAGCLCTAAVAIRETASSVTR